MIATRSATVTLVSRPRLVDSVLGWLLERVVDRVETVRERLQRNLVL